MGGQTYNEPKSLKELAQGAEAPPSLPVPPVVPVPAEKPPQPPLSIPQLANRLIDAKNTFADAHVNGTELANKPEYRAMQEAATALEAALPKTLGEKIAAGTEAAMEEVRNLNELKSPA